MFAVRMTGARRPSVSSGESGLQTSRVVRTDLSETTPESGTVGYAASYTIVEPAGNPSDSLTKDQQAVTSARQAVADDQSTLAGDGASSQQAVDQAVQALQSAQQTLSQDQATLQSDQSSLDAAQEKEANDCQGDAAAGSGSSGPSGSSSASSQCSSDQAQVSSDQQKVDQDQAAVTKDTQAVASAQDQVTSSRQKADQTADQDQAKLSADQTSLSDAESTMGSDQSVETSYGTNAKYTALPAVGQVIHPGQSLWSVDGAPVPLLPGALAPWRAFQAGMSPGSDVGVLNRALAQLGYGSTTSSSDGFTSATTAAIERLQSSLGLPVTGVLDLGAVVFEPTPVEVTSVTPLVGDDVAGGQPVLAVTSTTPVVNVELPVDQSYLVAVGDPVTATLPDGTTADGTITAVGNVATSTTDSGSGNGEPSATVNVTVALSHASAAGSLDDAPVTVNITNQSVSSALAVPTTALLALQEGGYAVEVVDADGAHHLVAVTTGLFDDQSGYVQVSGSGLAVGDRVVVPAS